MTPCKDCGEPNDDGSISCTRCTVSLFPEGVDQDEDAHPLSPEALSQQALSPQLLGPQLLSPLPAPDPPRAAAATVAFGQPQPVRRRLWRRASRQVIAAAGSKICSCCGKPDESSRPFCTECGFSLANAKVVREPDRWRRLLGPDQPPTPNPNQA